MRPAEDISSEFLYLLLLSDGVQNYTNALASGSAQRGIRKADFVKYELKLPNKEDMEKLTRQWKPLIDAIKVNERQIDELAKLRNSLLPKLMSGEMDVTNLEI